MSFVFVAVLAIAVKIAVALSPKAPTEKPAAFTDFDTPVAKEGHPVPVVFGVVTVTGPNVVWYGDLSYRAVKTRGGK
ncbi:MAG: hypothetical protein COA47_09930 [Robiginitomaculum sp.]|nr:MAG: hypothetical protein COA47_09930 [Robiginitomaculum sp.]